MDVHFRTVNWTAHQGYLNRYDADIYIFDELSTSLDGETTQKITANVLSALGERICIFIEHNLEIASLININIKLKGELQKRNKLFGEALLLLWYSELTINDSSK